jgi:hypothetical protein
VRREITEVKGPHLHIARGDSIVERRFPARAFERVVNDACHACNHGWMSDLETMAKPHLLPLVRGSGGRLGRDEQRILSAWAMKTAAMLEFSHPRALAIPQADRDWIREKGKPPPRTQVWIGLYAGARLNTWYRGDRFDALRAAIGTGASPYGITFLMGRVVFQLWGRSESNRILETKGRLGRGLKQIHPYLASVTVKPTDALDDRLLMHAAHSLRRPGKPRKLAVRLSAPH